MAERTPPKRLYKYRSFSDRTVGALVDDTVYYADPATFNDSPDTKPVLDIDITAEVLEASLAQMIEAHGGSYCLPALVAAFGSIGSWL